MGRNDNVRVRTALTRLVSIVTFATILTIPTFGEVAWAAKGEPEEQPQVCNANADYFLGIEDYPEAIRLHRRIVDRDPHNALAHYHLGFAYGIVGSRTLEKREYLRAINLGLKQWDLFLNLGLADFEDGEVKRAIAAFSRAVALAPGRSEVHFDLALAYERAGMPKAALHEISTSLELDPHALDARNTLALIYAELGDYEGARQVWTGILRDAPDYAPAQVNLEIVEHGHGLPASSSTGNEVTGSSAVPGATTVSGVTR